LVLKSGVREGAKNAKVREEELFYLIPSRLRELFT